MNANTNSGHQAHRFGLFGALSVVMLAASLAFGGKAWADTECPAESSWPTYTANVVVFDTSMIFNRLGAQNPNWIMYALRRDVIQRVAVNQ